MTLPRMLSLEIRLPHQITGSQVTFHPAKGSFDNALSCFERELRRIVEEETRPLREENDRLRALIFRVSSACGGPDAGDALRTVQTLLEESYE